MKNPFIVGKVIQDLSLLCPRTKESERISRAIESQQSIYVVGERRVGKSSLVLSVAKDLIKNKNMLMVYVDFRAVASQADVQKRIVSGILKVVNQIRDGAWFLSLLTKLKPQISPKENGEMEISLGIQDSLNQDFFSLSEIFDLIEKTNKRHKCLIVFDEFQDILRIGQKEGESILGIMRSRIQMESEIGYVFLGSERGEMNRIFEDYNSAFYHSALRVPIERFQFEEIYQYIFSLYQTGNRLIDQGVFSGIYELTHGITGDIQKVCSKAWDLTISDSIITQSVIESSMLELANENTSIYQDRINQMTPTQKKVIRGIVLESIQKFWSKEFIKQYSLKSKNDVQSTLESLLNQGVIYKHNGKYEFFDPFFKFWLKQTYQG
jgi:AAA+ ATPase superfamily predicted ATPase